MFGKGFLKARKPPEFLPEKQTDFPSPCWPRSWAGGCLALLASARSCCPPSRCAAKACSPDAAWAYRHLFLYVFINVAMVTG
jgi:hypothetical protein